MPRPPPQTPPPVRRRHRLTAAASSTACFRLSSATQLQVANAIQRVRHLGGCADCMRRGGSCHAEHGGVAAERGRRQRQIALHQKELGARPRSAVNALDVSGLICLAAAAVANGGPSRADSGRLSTVSLRRRWITRWQRAHSVWIGDDLLRITGSGCCQPSDVSQRRPHRQNRLEHHRNCR